jgi:hypothetical protein
MNSVAFHGLYHLLTHCILQRASHQAEKAALSERVAALEAEVAALRAFKVPAEIRDQLRVGHRFVLC